MRIDETLYTCRPEERRSEEEERCYEWLESAGVGFLRADHEPAGTMEDCVEIGARLGCDVAKNLLLTNRQKTELYLLLMPGDKPFRTKLLSAQIGTARLSFVSPEQMTEFLGTQPGSASVLGLLYPAAAKIHLLADRDLAGKEYFGCHPCRNTSTLRLKTADVLEKLLPYTGHSVTWVDLPQDPDAE